jgi:cysteine desulfurase
MIIGNAIYLDHQATTPVDPRVLEKMLPHLGQRFGNPHSSEHAFGWAAANAAAEAAAQVARLIGADPDEIVFTSGATEANNLALLGIGRKAAAGGRKRIVVSAIEHKCVLAAARALSEHYGFTVEHVGVDRAGRVDLEALQRMVGPDVLMVSVMAVNNEIGVVQDIEEIAAIARDAGALFHCDAAQAPLAVDLDVSAAAVDLVSLSAHKMYGPKGIGALFIRRGLEERIEPLIYGGGQQNGLRSGTVPVALCVGMGAAAALLSTAEAGTEREALARKRDRFARLLGQRWQIALNGPAAAQRHPGNANIRFEGFAAPDILGALQPRLAASTGAACTSGTPEPSHVLRAIGLSGDEADSSIRFSLGRDTTDEDVDQAVVLINEALIKLGREHLQRTA